MSNLKNRNAENDFLKDRIAEIVSQPKSYEIDGERAVNHSPQELIETDRYFAKKSAGRNPWKALHGVRISTQGPEK